MILGGPQHRTRDTDVLVFLLSLMTHSGDYQKESNIAWPSAGLVTAGHGGVFRGQQWQEPR